MAEKKIAPIVSDEAVISKIYFIREHKVTLDRDPAELHGVDTKVLKQAVRRNSDRFPAGFMFEMSKKNSGIGGHKM